MATTNFVTGTVIASDWLNEVDQVVHDADGANYVSFSPSGTGAVPTTVQTKLRESTSVKDFGAVGDGTTDDTAAIDAASTFANVDDTPLIIPKGTYLYGGTVYQVDGTYEWRNDGFTTGVLPIVSARSNAILLTAETQNVSPLDGKYTKVALGITVTAKGAQHGTGVRSNLLNYSTDGSGCTAMYARATSDTSANWQAAAHGETRHGGGTSIGLSSEAASYSTTGSLLGLVVNNTTTGAEATNSITGLSSVAHPSALAMMVQGANNVDPKGGWVTGLKFELNSMRDGGNGIIFGANAALVSQLTSTTTSYSSTADLLLQGNSTAGIIANGIYTNTAVRIADNQTLGLNSTSTVGMRYETAQGTSRATFRSGYAALTNTAQAGESTTITLAAGASATSSDPTYVGATIRITGGTGSGQNRTITAYNGATKVATVSSAWDTNPDATSTYSIRTSTERIGFNLTATPSIWLNSTQVVGTQATGWSAATGTATRTTFATPTVTTAQLAERLKALIDDLIAHGLIGT